MEIPAVLETVVYAHDLEAAERFYTGVLGLAVHSREPGRHVFFRCGQGMFLVFDPRATATSTSGLDVPNHGAEGPGHMAFRVPPADVDAWRTRLQDHGVAVERDLAWPGGGHSLYFRDPAGNSIELATASLWGLEEDRTEQRRGEDPS